jgi:hypothetical protein
MTRWDWVLGWVQLLAVVAGGAAVWGYRAELTAAARPHVRELAAGFLLLVGGGFLLSAVRFVAGRWLFVRRAGRATGRVVAVRVRSAPASEDGPDLDRYTPVVRFRADGRDIELVAGGAATTDADAWREGMPARVLFEPGDPDRAMLDDWTKWRPANVRVLFAAVCIGMGLLIAFGLRPTGD